ncbi:MAG: 3-dehydroquinate synthase [Geminicoccaceae bacterium]
MKDADELLVDLGERSYRILVGEGLIDEAGALIGPLIRQPGVIIVTDRHLLENGHLDTLSSALEAAELTSETFILPAGEQTKNFAQFEELVEGILALGIERGTTIIALGGGVIGDLAGFAAATLLRGLDTIQIPTTLLAQVDSSVGGKTGINSTHGKNLIGSFHQPKLVLADIGVLKSLPARELRAGYAEIVKYGLIDRPAFFGWLEENGQALLRGDADARRHAVIESCRAKAETVAADERESGRRALLNLGHTFGHALEAITGYGGELLHGEAVAIGMALAFRISALRGHCPEEDVHRVVDHLDAVDLPTSARTLQTNVTPDAMLAAMSRDKKVEAGIPRFILADGIGKAHAGVEIDFFELKAFLQAELD